MQEVEIFTDGACKGNPGPGGWGAILRYRGVEKNLNGAEANTTNNRMELTAALMALKTLKRPCRVILTTDSEYLRKGITEWIHGWKKKGWKRGKNSPVMNLELWKELDELRHMHRMNYHWVKGHNDHPQNERCDRLAVAAIEKFRG